MIFNGGKVLSQFLFLLHLVLFNSVSYSQNTSEEVLRHFKEGTKLVPHYYDQDTSTWGYIFGHNKYFDYEWAEKYQIDGSGLVMGIIANIKGSNPNPEKIALFSVYAVHKDRKPDKAIFTHSTTYDKIEIDGSDSKFIFDSAAYVKDSFFVAFGVYDYAHDPAILGKDTLTLLATEDGFRDDDDLKNYGRNCIRTHSIIPEIAWIDAYESMEGRKSVKAYLSIFPIMDFSSSTSNSGVTNGHFKLLKGFYNPNNHTINTTINTKKRQTLNLSLINLEGKELFKSQLVLEENQSKSISLIIPNGLTNGTYILIASSTHSKLAQKILVK